MADLNLTDQEQQVIYYIAYSLLKNYRNIERDNPRNTTCYAAMHFLLSLKLNGCEYLDAITFLQFVGSVAVRNRDDDHGNGLFKFGDDMYYLFV